MHHENAFRRRILKIKNQTGESYLPGFAAWEIHPVMKNRVQRLSPSGADFLVREFGDQCRAYQQRTPLAITAVHLLTREMR